MNTARLNNRGLNRYGIWDWALTALMLAICFITLYPVWYTIVLSFNESADTLMGGVYWWPRKFSLKSYQTVFLDKSITRAFGVTILRTLIGTVTNLSLIHI